MSLPEFKTKAEKFAWLIANKAKLIQAKKATTKHADAQTFARTTTKAAPLSVLPEDTDSVLHRTIVGNAYNWKDSHKDVHFAGIFTKSIKENGEKVLHLHDHIHQLSAEIGDNQRVYEKEMSWTDLGVAKTGNTTVLLMDTAVQKAYNPAIFQKYGAGRIQQHSVGMQYQTIFLAVNDPEYKEEFAAWSKYRPKVANGESADDDGYFWAVTVAKVFEISAVIKGSNEITPTLGRKSLSEAVAEADEETQKKIKTILDTVPGTPHTTPEPPKGTPDKRSELYKHILKQQG
jgi:hypothetical protein